MGTVQLTVAAGFYVAASQSLSHGHSLSTGDMRYDKEKKVVLVNDWPVSNVGHEDGILGIDDVHLLHRYYGGLNNKSCQIAGLEGWNRTRCLEEGDSFTRYEHTTGTGRMTLWVRSSKYGEEACGVDIRRGSDSHTVCQLRYANHWDGRYEWSAEFPLAGGEDEAIERKDRFAVFLDIMYGVYSDIGTGELSCRIDDKGLFGIPKLGPMLRSYAEELRENTRKYRESNSLLDVSTRLSALDGA